MTINLQSGLLLLGLLGDSVSPLVPVPTEAARSLSVLLPGLSILSVLEFHSSTFAIVY
jgi:hypothetical protein